MHNLWVWRWVPRWGWAALALVLLGLGVVRWSASPTAVVRLEHSSEQIVLEPLGVTDDEQVACVQSALMGVGAATISTALIDVESGEVWQLTQSLQRLEGDASDRGPVAIATPDSVCTASMPPGRYLVRVESDATGAMPITGATLITAAPNTHAAPPPEIVTTVVLKRAGWLLWMEAAAVVSAVWLALLIARLLTGHLSKRASSRAAPTQLPGMPDA